ncbi:hypothetical protein [Tolypothrix sp. PCC 7910]|uniref:hypothetical protein n=1 Tax=Tolypothrix sp. PCC 7910 TaxID=2099387 RepID=UPI00143199C3|nr:hypothetical protein [Tolypothrix sp. PCC 7910]
MLISVLTINKLDVLNRHLSSVAQVLSRDNLYWDFAFYDYAFAKILKIKNIDKYIYCPTPEWEISDWL